MKSDLQGTPLRQDIQLKIQDQQSAEEEAISLDPQHQLLLDEMTLSPLQKYRKYGRFPWEIILTALMIISSTFSVQATVQVKYAQERQIQTFFNFHILAHDSFDIYEGTSVFTWRTQEYRSFQDIYEFFNRSLQVLIGLDGLNFYPINTTLLNQTVHTVKRVFRDGSSVVDEFTLPELIEQGYLTLRLKDYLANVRSMRLVFVIYNMSANVQELNLVFDIEIKQKFLFFVEINTDFIETNFTTDKRVLPDVDSYNETQLGIRKQPNMRHGKTDPPRIGYLAGVVLIALTLKSIFVRYSAYKKHPMLISGITEGQPFVSLSFRQKVRLLGVWNILMVLLCLGSFMGGGISVFLCWVQLIRYLQNTKNPFLISFLLRKVIWIEAALLLNIMIVLTGFVMFSMVVFTETKKFETVRLSYFQYIFNNFQYGIYENFIAIGSYSGFAQMLYYFLLFYMVSCANQMLPSLLCNLVISRKRYQQLQETISQIKIPCPMCQNIPNSNQRPKELGESRVVLEVASPVHSPFLTPNTIPMRAMRKQQIAAELKKKTVFQIKKQVQSQKKSNQFHLYVSRIELLNAKFEECVLVIEINKQPKYKNLIAEYLLQAQSKLNLLWKKIATLSKPPKWGTSKHIASP